MKIVLCGFMGCGKSSIGAMVQKKTNVNFCEIDTYVVEKYKLSISKIFEKYGEDFFRKAETDALIELLKSDDVLIGSGGGTVINPINSKIIKESGAKIIFLDVPLAAIQERLKNDKKRPLLQREDREDFIEKLYNQRKPIYENASDIVIPAGAPVKVVAKKIIKLLRI